MKRRFNLLLLVSTCAILSLTLSVGCKKRGPKPDAAATPVTSMEQEPTPVPSSEESTTSRITEEEMRRRKIESEKQEVLQDIYFDFDRWMLSMKARAVLSSVGDWMLKNPNIKLLIEGHCDERGSVEYNLALGQKRANAAKDYLVDYGISGGRLSTISYGEERPLDAGHDEAAWVKNRRAHFVLIDN